MVLVDWQIRKLCEAGLVDPFDPEMINPSSIDIRIGYTAMCDTGQGFRDFDFYDFTKDFPYFMQPNECLLVATLESFNVPDNIAIELKLKSSRAREGLSHALAGWVDNGFHGILTLELKNYSTKHPVAIYPGLRIGQLILHETLLPDKTYQSGRYAGHNTVIGSMDSHFV
jgi:dCTP deaminase